MIPVQASVSVLRWAARRARMDDEELIARFRKWPLWLSGEAQPTCASNIPNVCIGLGLRFMTPYEMLRIEKAKFVLRAAQ